MPKQNDLEGAQDQGGKHGGQKGVPKPEPRPEHCDEGDGDICSPRQEPSTDDDTPLP
jgi:hypothetical protein